MQLIGNAALIPVLTALFCILQEAIEKKEQRAKRFHFRAEVNLAQRNVALDRDMMKKGTSLSNSQEEKMPWFTFSQFFYLLYPIIFPASPEVFPDHYQNKSLWVFFHLLILISLFFKLLDSYHFTPCFTNPGKKETFFVYLIYCLAASSSASYPRFIFWISAALKISSFFEMTRPWAFFAYEWRTLCAMHSEIRFCAVCTVEQDWLRMCS